MTLQSVSTLSRKAKHSHVCAHLLLSHLSCLLSDSQNSVEMEIKSTNRSQASRGMLAAAQCLSSALPRGPTKASGKLQLQMLHPYQWNVKQEALYLIFQMQGLIRSLQSSSPGPMEYFTGGEYGNGINKTDQVIFLKQGQFSDHITPLHWLSACQGKHIPLSHSLHSLCPFC